MRKTRLQKIQELDPRYPEYLRYVSERKARNESPLPFPQWNGKRILLDQFLKA